jgi:hypothetical protein
MSVCCIRRQAACLHSAMEATPLARDHLNKERPRRARGTRRTKPGFMGSLDILTSTSGPSDFARAGNGRHPAPGGAAKSRPCVRDRSARLGDASANARGGIVYEELFRVSKRKPQNRTCWRKGEPYEGITTNQLGLDRHREYREMIQSGGSSMR